MLQQETCRPKVIYGREALPAKEDVWMILFTVSLLLATDEKTFCVPCTAGSTRSFTGSCTSLHVKHYVSNLAAAATNSNPHNVRMDILFRSYCMSHLKNGLAV